MGETNESKEFGPHEAARDTVNQGKGEKPKDWHSAPFDDEGVTISAAFAQQMGLARALILDHIFFTFVHHYDSPAVFRGPHPDRPAEQARTWIYFTMANFVRHIGLAESNIRTHLKALAEDGWIETFRESGKKAYFRPNLERFFNSSHYRAKVRRLSGEPDFPGSAPPPPPAPMPPPPESRPPSISTPIESGGVPPSNQAGYPHRISGGLHILEEPLKEPSKKNPAGAHANARRTDKGGDGDTYQPRYPNSPTPPADEGTPFDRDDQSTDEESRARHKRVLLAALLDGNSASLIRRRAADWGFDIDDLVKEASEIAARRRSEPRAIVPTGKDKVEAQKANLAPSNRVA